jgi:lysophospholipase L1-like esterase
MRRSFRRLTPRWIVVGLLAALVAAELGLRRLGYASLPVTDMHPTLGWMLLPNQERSGRYGESLSINGHGMRDRAWAAPAAEGLSVLAGGRRGLRVVVLGDSRPYGYGVALDETFPRRLEAALRVDDADRLVMNFGQPGFHLSQFVRLYELNARRWRPDFVVVCVGTIAITPMLPPLVERNFPLNDWIVRTALWDALDRRWLLARHGRAAREHWIRTGQLAEAEAAQRGFKLARDAPWSEEARPLWDAAAVELARLSDAVVVDGGRLIVLVLPRRTELQPGAAEQLAERWRALVPTQHVASGTVAVVDVAATLRALDAPFLASDTEHLTPAGHAAVATALAPALARSTLK